MSGNGSLTMNPGIYVITGGGFSVSGNGAVTGSGVLIYNTGTSYPSAGGSFGAITLSGNGTLNLCAPTSGTYAGDVIFQSRDNNQPLLLSGNGLAGLSGNVYAAKASLTLSGNARLNDALIVNTLTLIGNSVFNTLSGSDAAFTPAQLRAAYGIANVTLDGTGQVIALVEAYDDPNLALAVDTFDTQFGASTSGPTLYDQYGPATSFLTVINQAGNTDSMPAADPTGGWEMEATLDVEWAHALAPGARIVVVESNSQSLGDLMASVVTAAIQPGVSVVSMSWGFVEGHDVLAADEALYDGDFTTPQGHTPVTFVASTGDYGSAVPEYPAFSPNVVAIGGTSLYLNADGTYNTESGWGYYSNTVGAFIGSGGGTSAFEPRPGYQAGVQSSGYRSTPDVSFVADPATGAWIADPYNRPGDNPWQIVGGTSLSAPSWAGLIALVNQGRANGGLPTLSSNGGTTIQGALYSAPASNFNSITSGTNGDFTASAGYNQVTGLGTPVANLLIPSLIAYQGTSPVNASATADGPVNANAIGSTNAFAGRVFNVFNALSLGTPTAAHVPQLGRTADVQPPALAPLTSAPSARVQRAVAPAGQGETSGSARVATSTGDGGLRGFVFEANAARSMPGAALYGSYPLDANVGHGPGVAGLSGPAGALFSPTQQGATGGDVLVGGDGDDMVVGGDGSDFMISGFGRASASDIDHVKTPSTAAATAQQADAPPVEYRDVLAPMLQSSGAAAADLRAAFDAFFAEMGAIDDSPTDVLDL